MVERTYLLLFNTMDVEEILKTFDPLLDVKGLFIMLLLSPSSSSCTEEEKSSFMALIDDFHDLTEEAGQYLSKPILIRLANETFFLN